MQRRCVDSVWSFLTVSKYIAEWVKSQVLISSQSGLKFICTADFLSVAITLVELDKTVQFAKV